MKAKTEAAKGPKRRRWGCVLAEDGSTACGVLLTAEETESRIRGKSKEQADSPAKKDVATAKNSKRSKARPEPIRKSKAESKKRRESSSEVDDSEIDDSESDDSENDRDEQGESESE